MRLGSQISLSASWYESRVCHTSEVLGWTSATLPQTEPMICWKYVEVSAVRAVKNYKALAAVHVWNWDSKVFLRAKRTSNWSLHVTAITHMLNLFAATGCLKYAKCSIYTMHQCGAVHWHIAMDCQRMSDCAVLTLCINVSLWFTWQWHNWLDCRTVPVNSMWRCRSREHIVIQQTLWRFCTGWKVTIHSQDLCDSAPTSVSAGLTARNDDGIKELDSCISTGAQMWSWVVWCGWKEAGKRREWYQVIGSQATVYIGQTSTMLQDIWKRDMNQKNHGTSLN